MEKQINGYLISQLKDGRNLDITLLSHNSEWTRVELLQRHYKNCNVKIFGSDTSYLIMARAWNNEKYKKVADSDLIVFYSPRFFDENEINYLKNLALAISNIKNKRVTIGYQYLIKEQDKVRDQVQIISFKEDEVLSQITYSEHYGAYYLTEMTLVSHDSYELENSKKLIKTTNN